MAEKRSKIEKSTDSSRRLSKEISDLKEKFSVEDAEILNLIYRQLKEKKKIPISIFSQKKLSSLEAIVKYLRENKHLNFREIGDILCRSKFTIASTYRSAKSKSKEKFSISYSEFDIPYEVIANRKLSVLESIVSFLKEEHSLKFSHIARLLELDQRTVWTVYSRARKKNEKQEQ